MLLREQPLYVLPTRRTPALGALQAHRAPALSGGSRSGRHCDGDERRGRRGAGAGADAGRGGRRRRVSAAAAGRPGILEVKSTGLAQTSGRLSDPNREFQSN